MSEIAELGLRQPFSSRGMLSQNAGHGVKWESGVQRSKAEQLYRALERTRTLTLSPLYFSVETLLCFLLLGRFILINTLVFSLANLVSDFLMGDMGRRACGKSQDNEQFVSYYS